MDVAREATSLRQPQQIVLVRMASPQWAEWLAAEMDAGYRMWYWIPRGQQRLIYTALFRRGLITHSEEAGQPELVLTEHGQVVADYLIKSGVGIDG